MHRRRLTFSHSIWIKNCVGSVLVATLSLGAVGGAPAFGVTAENSRRAKPMVTIPEATASLIEGIVAYQIWTSESKERDCRTVGNPDLFARGFIEGDSRVRKVFTDAGLSESKALAAAAKGYVVGCMKQPTRKYARLAGAGAVVLAIADFTPGMVSSLCATYRQDPKSVIQVVLAKVTHTALPRAFEDGVGKGFSGGCSQF